MHEFKSIVEKIFLNYPTDFNSSFGGDKPTYQAFKELKDWIKDEVIKDREEFLVKFSCGQGNWTQSPHFSILNNTEATDTRDGFYIVGLFKHDMSGFYLCFGQGITGPTNHYGTQGGAEYLLEKAAEVKPYLETMQKHEFSFDKNEFDLAVTGGVAMGYGPGICMHKFISNTNIPDDNLIKTYLNDLINCYDQLLNNNCSSNLRHVFAGVNYWILAAGEGAKYWNEFKDKNFVSIGWQIGDLTRYRTKKAIEEKILEINPSREARPRNDALCCFDFANTIKNGDIVFIKEGTKKIIGVGEIESDYTYQDNPNHPHLRKIKWLSFKEMDHIDITGSRAATKTLTNITRYNDYIEKLKKYYFDSEEKLPLINEKNEIENILKNTFFAKEEFLDIVKELEIKKNVIIEGPPGVGKTFIASKISKYVSGSEERQLNLVFHENYSYEEFIMGIRPDNDGKFKLSDGQFLRFSRKAQADPNNKYVLLIDEINRANITKVFGEFLLNIENDKRGKDYSINLMYSVDEIFFIPENIYIIGLMNTADRSLKVIDYALRRRFSFRAFLPEFTKPEFKQFLIHKNVNSNVIDKIINNMDSINQKIADETLELGPGYCIGHSFFCPSGSETSYGLEWYKSIIDNQVIPLLKEYYFDRPEKIEDLKTELLS